MFAFKTFVTKTKFIHTLVPLIALIVIISLSKRMTARGKKTIFQANKTTHTQINAVITFALCGCTLWRREKPKRIFGMGRHIIFHTHSGVFCFIIFYGDSENVAKQTHTVYFKFIKMANRDGEKENKKEFCPFLMNKYGMGMVHICLSCLLRARMCMYASVSFLFQQIVVAFLEQTCSFSAIRVTTYLLY